MVASRVEDPAGAGGLRGVLVFLSAWSGRRGWHSRVDFHDTLCHPHIVYDAIRARIDY